MSVELIWNEILWCCEQKVLCVFEFVLRLDVCVRRIVDGRIWIRNRMERLDKITDSSGPCKSELSHRDDIKTNTVGGESNFLHLWSK